MNYLDEFDKVNLFGVYLYRAAVNMESRCKILNSVLRIGLRFNVRPSGLSIRKTSNALHNPSEMR